MEVLNANRVKIDERVSLQGFLENDVTRANRSCGCNPNIYGRRAASL